VLVPYSSQDTTEYLSGDVFITQVDGGWRVPFILQPDNFDDGFVRKEGVPGFPSPLEAGRFGPGAQRCFLTRLKDVAIALGKESLVPKLPNNGEDFITSGLICPGCSDRSPLKGWFVHGAYPDHAPLRETHKHLVRSPGQGVRFYHSIASCPFLWKRLHQYVKANPSRTALFDHTKGASPPTKCVVVEQAPSA